MAKKHLLLLIFLPILFLLLIFFYFNFYLKEAKIISGLGLIPKRRLDQYSFENLQKEKFPSSKITFFEKLSESEEFNSYKFQFLEENKRKVSGLANIPKNRKGVPILVMFRGYVDRENYKSGVGTKNSAEYFAKNGYLTLAPDFLGYGDSDNPSKDPLEDRFETYTTALSLLSSLPSLNESLKEINPDISIDINKVGFWGHSNGGQIALSILAITAKNYPTVLWAPVSKPFPYSILFFTDEFSDHGKALRKLVADFEKDYDVEKYSTTNYFNFINAPISLHQGTNDEEVPQKWSDELYQSLTEMGKKISYFTYPGENHNFQNGLWTQTIQRSLDFFNSYLK